MCVVSSRAPLLSGCTVCGPHAPHVAAADVVAASHRHKSQISIETRCGSIVARTWRNTNRYVGIFERTHTHAPRRHAQNASHGVRRHRTSARACLQCLRQTRLHSRCPSWRSRPAWPDRIAARACVNAPPGGLAVAAVVASICLLGWPLRHSCDCRKNVVTQTWRHMHIQRLVPGNLLVFAIARSG